MILSGKEITRQVSQNRITIEPFDHNNINPNSYNYTLDKYIKVYDKNELDAKEINETRTIEIPDEGMVLEPNKIYLGCTKEIIGSDYYVPILTGRSSTGRLGLFVHITSDLVDVGFHGKLTLQFHATQPVRIYKDMAIGQITFWCIYGETKLYEGKYQDSNEPRASEVWRDFK